MKRRVSAIILALCLALTLMPNIAFAEGGAGSNTTVETINDLQEGVNFAYDAAPASDPVIIDGQGVSVMQWADAWVHQNTTIKNVTFENGASFNAAANGITLTLENCTFKACDQSKITVTHKVNSGAGMCLNVEKSDKTGVSFVIKGCTFIGDGGADVPRAGNKYDQDGTVLDPNKARGHAIALDAICGGGTGTLKSLLIEGCEITNTRGNAIQLYGETGDITIKDTRINSWGQNNAMDKDDAAIRGDYKADGSRTITLSNVYFGLDENDSDSAKKLYHVNVGAYSQNTDKTQKAGLFVPKADITITTVEQFKDFIAGINSSYSYKGKVVALANNIDLENAELPQNTGNFAGTFDGQGYTVKNLKMSKPLFVAQITATGTVKNLTVENAVLENTAADQQRLGIICRNLNGTLENVHVKDCTITSEKALGVVGGLAAMTQTNSTVKNCSVENLTVHASKGSPNIGGAFGLLMGDNVTVTDVAVSGSITVTGTGSGKDSSGKQVGMTVKKLWGADRRGDNATVTGNNDTGANLVTNNLASPAKIGDTFYRTLYSAVYDSNPGDTVTVIKDIKIGLSDFHKDGTQGGITYYTWVYVNQKDLTLDLNGHTINIADSAKNITTNHYRLFLLMGNSKMTVTGSGKIIGDGGTANGVNDFYISEQNGSNSHLTIENGEFSASGSEIIFARAHGNQCTINGGNFEGIGESYDTSRALNCQGGGSTNNFAFSITGGTCVGFDPRHMDDGNLVADGSCVKESTRADSVKVYTVAVHNKATTSAVTKEPSYTEEGVRTYYCANCGGVVGTETIVKLTSSGSSSSGSSKYNVTVESANNGSAAADRKSAVKGTTVTITVTPDTGYTLETITVTDKNGKKIELTDKGNGKYAFQMPAGAVTVNTTFAEDTALSNSFVDVPASAYYYDAVEWAAKSGITGGVDETHFAPDRPCTRAQIVTFLWRAAGSPEPTTQSSFSDVSAGAYYAKAVAWAVENGITTGVTADTFCPDQTCTRAQAVAFLFRYAVSQGMDAVTLQELVSSYGDAAQVPGYALSALNWALASSIVTGNDGNLMPGQPCTRAQIVTMLYRLLGTN